MSYKQKLIFRLGLALIIAIFGEALFYTVLFKPFFYLSYLSLLFYNPVIFGNSLLIGENRLVFVSACLAVSAYVLLSILILLTKDIKFIQGLKMFLAGSLTLFFVNLARIFILAIILLEFSIGLFDTLHLFFWDIFSTIFVFFLWIGLIKYYKIKAIPIYSDFYYIKKKID